MEIEHEKCKHKIIKDYIDIDPEKSKVIFYCIYCLECFKHTS